MTAPSTSVITPFPGMRPFRREDAPVFFGQAEPLNRLIARLADSRFVAVLGVSGCGKSSLVEAGLIPELAGEFGSAAESGWTIVKTQPGNQPLRRLAESLAGAGLCSSVDDVLSRLRSDSRAITGLVETAADYRRFLLIVDQFEELFTYVDAQSGGRPDGPGAVERRDEAALYVKLLLAARNNPYENLYVVLTMRSEYVGRCSEFFGLAEAITEGMFLLPKMTWAQREAAIGGPVGGAARVENALVQRLLNESENAPEDGLPLMQHALRRIWERARANGEGRLALAHLDVHGKAPGSQLLIQRDFEDHVEAIFREIPNQAAGIRMFKLLGRYDENGQLVRRRENIEIIAAVAGVGVDDVRAMVKLFCDESKGRSFLTISIDTDAGGTVREWVGVSHEALLRQWSKVRRWIEEEANDANQFRRLAELADKRQLGDAGLMTGRELSRMSAWFRASRPTPAWAKRYEGVYDERLGRARLSFPAAERYLRQSEYRRWVVRLTVALLALVVLNLAGRSWRAQQAANRAEFARALEKGANEKLAGVNEQLSAANSEKTRIIQDLALANEQLKQANERNTEINKRLTKINGKMAQTNGELRQANQRNIDINEKLTAANKELAQAKEKTDRTNQDLKEAKDKTEIALAREIEAQQKQEQAERVPRARADVAQALALGWGAPENAPALSTSVAQIAESIRGLYKDTGKLYRFHADALLELLGRGSLKSSVPPSGALAAGVHNGSLVLASPTGTRPGRRKGPEAQRAIVSPDGSMQVYGFPKGYVSLVWPDGARTAKIHTFAIAGLGMSRDGKWLASSNTSGAWNVQPVDKLRTPNRTANALRRFAAELSLGWRMVTRSIPGDYPIQQLAVANGVGGSKPAIAAVSESGTLQYVQRSRTWKRPPQPGFRFGAVTVDATGVLFWAGAKTGDVGSVDDAGFTPVYRPAAVPVTALAWDDTGTRLAAGLQDGRIIVIVNADASRSTHYNVQLPGSGSPVAGLSWAAGNLPLLASSGADGSAKFWDVSALVASPELMDRLFRLSGTAAVPQRTQHSPWEIDPRTSEEVAKGEVDVPGLLKLLEEHLKLHGLPL